MKTKEAIKWLNNFKVCLDNEVYCGDDKKLTLKELREIATLLENGEKFEAIVKEIDERLMPGKGIEYDSDKIAISDFSTLDFIKLIIKDIKQKYFPLVKRTVDFDIELDSIDLQIDVALGIRKYINNIEGVRLTKDDVVSIKPLKGGS